jgi:hypothetical protein
LLLAFLPLSDSVDSHIPVDTSNLLVIKHIVDWRASC